MIHRGTRAPVIARALGLMALLWGLRTHAAEELRGLWVDTFRPAMRGPDEVRKLVEDARAGGFNALFVQLRRRGDAWYGSTFEPTATEVPPEFDPLQHLLALAHDPATPPQLEVHAWTIVFNVWNHATQPPKSPDHPYLRYPSWLTRSFSGATWDGANYAFDPGHPEVQEYTFQTLMDLVRRYPIDGLHLDYIRYAGRDWGYHPEAVRRFNTRHSRDGKPPPGDPNWLQFRRDQITALVRKLYLACLEERPALKVSAATVAFAPGITRTDQWKSSAAFGEVLQDWRAWMEEGILDWNIPMLYFRHGERAGSLADWNQFVKDHQYRRRAAIGLGFYLNAPSNIITQIRLARLPSPAGHTPLGIVAYSYASPSRDLPRAEVFGALRHPSRHDLHSIPVFAGPAVVPPTPWKSDRGVAHPKGFVRSATTEIALEGAEVRFEGPTDRTLRTDATGFFGAVDLPPGDYRVRVATPGFDLLESDASLRGGAVAHFDFPLTPTPVPTAP